MTRRGRLRPGARVRPSATYPTGDMGRSKPRVEGTVLGDARSHGCGRVAWDGLFETETVRWDFLVLTDGEKVSDG